MSFGRVETMPRSEEFHCFDSLQGHPNVGLRERKTARRMQQKGALVALNNKAIMEAFESNLGRVDAARRAWKPVHPGWSGETLANVVLPPDLAAAHRRRLVGFGDACLRTAF
jgi:hypothetical protein